MEQNIRSGISKWALLEVLDNWIDVAVKKGELELQMLKDSTIMYTFCVVVNTVTLDKPISQHIILYRVFF